MELSIRNIEDKLFMLISGAVAILTSLILIVLIGIIFINALPSLDLQFILSPESQVQGLFGGLLNAIVGTIYLTLFSVIIAAPVGIGTAIYLKRYTNDNPAVKITRFMIDVLSGTPSIVVGVFGLLFFCYYLKPITGGYSMIAGCIALGILIVPVIERATEDAINTVPNILEEGSYALGAEKWDTIRRITLPFAIPGIMSGVILGAGRAAEESAVVLLTAGYTQFMPEYSIQPNSNMLLGVSIYPFNDRLASLPIAIYNAVQNQNLIPISKGFAAAFVLILIVMLINASARVIIWKWKMH